MSFRKSNENQINNQKSKSKGLIFNKCFSITKNLFQCKSNPHTKNGNYEYISYESDTQTNTQMKSINQPATSTMIEQQSFYGSSQLIFYPTQDPISKILDADQNVNHQDEQANYEVMNDSSTTLQSCHDMELTRKRRTSLESLSSNHQTSNRFDYEDITIVKHNNSPLSDFRTLSAVEPCKAVFECLHSTKLSTDCNYGNSNSCAQCLHGISKCSSLSPKLEPRNSLESSSFISLSNSPVSSSSQIETKQSVDNQEISHQITMLDTIISDLSASVLDESAGPNPTFVCSNNYEATFVEDVSVHFADTVRILRDNNEEWLYVQVANDGRQGYVPRAIVLDLNQFIDQLKLHRNQLTRSKAALLEFPISV